MEIFKLVGSIFVDNDKANESIAKTDKKAQSMGQTFLKGAKVAAEWAAGIATAAGAAGAAVVKMAAGYETSFAQVQTLLSGSEEDIKAYSDAIIAASSATGVSVAEFSESVYSALSAGVDQADAIGFVTDALQLAKGGFTDTATAVDVMTTALNAYGLESSEASRISDVLITTQNLGKTTVDELASSMGKIIPIASAYNIDVENLGASYATLTAGGIATAESTTMMKAMFTELSKSGSKVSDVLINETGKSFSELMESGYSVADVIDVISQSVDGDTTAFSNLWSSTEAGTGALALANAGADKFNETLGAMKDAAGSTTDAFSTMNDTLSSKMAKMKNSIANIGIAIGNSLLPIVSDLIDTVNTNMPVFQSFAESLVPVLQQIFENLLPPIMQLTGELFPVLVSILGTIIPLVTQVLNAILPVLITLLKTLLPPLIQIVQAILPPLLELLSPLILLLQPILELLQPILSIVTAITTPIGELMSKAIAPLTSLLSALISTALIPLNVALTTVSGLIEGVFNAAFAHVINVVDTVRGILGGFIDFITGVFTGNWEKAWSGIAKIFGSVFEGIANFFKIPINFIIDGLNAFVKGINKIKVPDWVPGVGGKGINIPLIPKLEGGGVLERGQVGLLEGNGAEAVVPLDQNKAWISAVAKDVKEAGMGGLSNELGRKMVDLMEQMLKKLDDIDFTAEIVGDSDNMFDVFTRKSREAVQLGRA